MYISICIHSTCPHSRVHALFLSACWEYSHDKYLSFTIAITSWWTVKYHSSVFLHTVLAKMVKEVYTWSWKAIITCKITFQHVRGSLFCLLDCFYDEVGKMGAWGRLLFACIMKYVSTLLHCPQYTRARSSITTPTPETTTWGSSLPSCYIDGYLVFSGETNAQKQHPQTHTSAGYLVQFLTVLLEYIHSWFCPP